MPNIRIIYFLESHKVKIHMVELTTPANLGGNPKRTENNSNPGEKNSSVVEFKSRNRISNISDRLMMRIIEVR